MDSQEKLVRELDRGLVAWFDLTLRQGKFFGWLQITLLSLILWKVW